MSFTGTSAFKNKNQIDAVCEIHKVLSNNRGGEKSKPRALASSSPPSFDLIPSSSAYIGLGNLRGVASGLRKEPALKNKAKKIDKSLSRSGICDMTHNRSSY